jgi:hypothetical protein
MNQNDIQQLGQLAGLLHRMGTSLWSVQDIIEDGTDEEEARALSILRRACAAIDRVTRSAIEQFWARAGAQVDGAVSATLSKGRPIANKPGSALLPAPSNPAVERWQRTAQPSTQSQPVVARAETITAGHNAVVVRPSSDYEGFLAKQLSPGTRKSYAAAMRHFIKALGLESEEELLTIGPEMLIAYRNAQIEAGDAPATIARRLSTLRSFFSMMVTLGRMTKNPADSKLVRSPRVPREGITPSIEAHEVRKLLKAPDTSTIIGKRDRAILAIGLYLGLRREEIECDVRRHSNDRRVVSTTVTVNSALPDLPAPSIAKL